MRSWSALAAARTARGAAGDGPLHRRADEDGRVLRTAIRIAAAGAAAIDRVAMELVVGDPVDVVEAVVVALQGIIIVVPELLPAFFFAVAVVAALVMTGPERPLGLPAAVVAGARSAPVGGSD